MSPEQAAAFLRAQADAILMAGTPVRIALQVTPTEERALPLTSGERSARQRARERLDAGRQRPENGTAASHNANGGTKGGPDLDQAFERKMPEDPEGSMPGITYQVSVPTSRGTGRDFPAVPSHTEFLPAGRARKVTPKRGPLWHFVPEGWAPNAKHRSDAIGLLVDVDAEAEKFRNYEFKSPRSDPDRAFAVWIRSARERSGPRRVQDGHQAVFERFRRLESERNTKTVLAVGEAAE